GTGPAALLYALTASLELLNEVGRVQISQHLEQLTDYLCELLAAKEYEIVSSRQSGEKSQIVCIRHRGGISPMKLYGQLKSRNIITAPRNDRLRVAPHLYNTS